MTRINQHGAVTALRPSIPLQEENLPALDRALRPSLKVGIPYVVIDLGETPLIDGAGLEWLLDLDEECCRRGGCVRLSSANELCRDILRVTSVGHAIESFEDLADALGSFA